MHQPDDHVLGVDGDDGDAESRVMASPPDDNARAALPAPTNDPRVQDEQRKDTCTQTRGKHRFLRIPTCVKPPHGDYCLLLSQGRLPFATDRVSAAPDAPTTAAQDAIRRLKNNGVATDPYRSFHVVIPPQYRRLGCRPAQDFLPDLMEHLGAPHYAAVLVAARCYHGAGHKAPLITRNLDNGVLHLSSPEANAVELVGYPQHCGFLGIVATVPRELAGTLEGPAQAAEESHAPAAWVQRQGVPPCEVGTTTPADVLDPILEAQAVYLAA